MSYVRWSAPGKPHPYDSALYIYDDTNGEITCCGCLFEPMEDLGGHFNYGAKTHDEMIAHVQKHIRYGHEVPDFVIPRLEAARDETP